MSTTATAVGSTISSVLVIIASVVFVRRCFMRIKAWRRAAPAKVPSSGSTSAGSSSRIVAGAPLDVAIDLGPIEMFLDQMMKEKPVRFSSEHLRSFTGNFREQLGSGGFGVVYKGQLPNGLQIAVKVLKISIDSKILEQLMAEIGTIGRTYHVNIVRLYGFCFEKDKKALVYEFMENGSLEKYLYAGKDVLEWRRLLEIAVGTAKGLRYMHEECQKKIVHYDIKPANILLSRDFTPKVADFGLAKIFDRDNTHVSMTGGRGTPGYAAPEMWMGFRVTEKCDVYSFGMVLFEILGRRRNYDVGVKDSESVEWFPLWVWEKYEQGDMETILSESRIEEKDKDAARKMCQVALWCVQYRPDARPTMSSVVRMLEGEMEIVPPVNPFVYLQMQSDAASSSTPWSSSTASTFHGGSSSPTKRGGSS